MDNSLQLICKLLRRRKIFHCRFHSSNACKARLISTLRPILPARLFSSSSNNSSINQSHVTFNVQELEDRGLIENVFPMPRREEFPAHVSQPQGMYSGFDPTADSLHIGNLLSILVLLHGQRAGHRPHIVVGGATGMIGDPSGKISDRVAMSAEDVEKNIVKLTENVNRIFQNHAEYIAKDRMKLAPHRIMNNADWYRSENIIDFMSTTCRHFRLGDMLKKQSVQSRLEQPQGGMSCTEFMYQVFQASDWLHLYKHHNCTIQIGGNDQTGNIQSGFELIRSVTGGFPFGLLVPLLLDEKGKKLGKSTGNSIWLDPTKSSPHHMYQYFFNLPDASVMKFLGMLTFLSREEIEAIMIQHNNSLHKRVGQKKIAEQVTLLIHGEHGLRTALTSTEVLFGKNPVEHLRGMSSEELQHLFGSSSTFDLQFDPQMNVLQFVSNVGKLTGFLAKTSGKKKKDKDGFKAAEDLINTGGLYINQQRVTCGSSLLGTSDFVLPNNSSLVRFGKKNYCVVRWLF